jgi:hypothetical protein
MKKKTTTYVIVRREGIWVPNYGRRQRRDRKGGMRKRKVNFMKTLLRTNMKRQGGSRKRISKERISTILSRIFLPSG